jgi:hypothetical protein
MDTATFQAAEERIDYIRRVGDNLSVAVRMVQELEDERPLVKSRCIAQMIGTPNPLGKEGAVHSASSAEKVVEEHPEYMDHRRKQANAEVQKIRAYAAYEAAKLSARLAVAAAEGGAL